MVVDKLQKKVVVIDAAISSYCNQEEGAWGAWEIPRAGRGNLEVVEG